VFTGADKQKRKPVKRKSRFPAYFSK